MLKSEVRFVGFDDGSFRKRDTSVIVVGAVLRGSSVLEGVLSTYIQIDGDDATTNLTTLINHSKHRGQLRCIFLDGIAFGGFNVVDINALNKNTGLPVVVVSRKKPNMRLIKRALKNVPNHDHKWKLIKSSGPVYKFRNIYFQHIGCTKDEARDFLSVSLDRSSLPECIRVAHLIATGVSRGESTARP
ncbi:MAG: DUF99 family protein [Candidatus Diapherotrites archaeon]|nr:DUF99 family protein [Candidatus Diapherotrites archaeon]